MKCEICEASPATDPKVTLHNVAAKCCDSRWRCQDHIALLEITKEEQQRKFEIVREQSKEIIQTGSVTCQCGKTSEVWRFTFRCFYCGIWFCQKCASKHFRSG